MRVAPRSHHTIPGSVGGGVPEVRASIHARDDAGNLAAKISGYRWSNARFRAVARTIRRRPARPAPNGRRRCSRAPPASCSSIVRLRRCRRMCSSTRRGSSVGRSRRRGRRRQTARTRSGASRVRTIRRTRPHDRAAGPVPGWRGGRHPRGPREGHDRTSRSAADRARCRSVAGRRGRGSSHRAPRDSPPSCRYRRAARVRSWSGRAARASSGSRRRAGSADSGFAALPRPRVGIV